jgi:predicted NUDIX family phosphoesterase
MNKMDNKIIAVSTNEIENLLLQIMELDGFKPLQNREEYTDIVKISKAKRRGDLETNTEYRQILPYLIVKVDNKFFYYVRAEGSDETRLHNRFSIGIGGHIEMKDKDSPQETMETGLIREAREELGENIELVNLKPLGFIYTNKTILDEVHLGILFTCEINGINSISVDKEEIGEHGFLDEKEMDEIIINPNYSPENWTDIVWKKAREII